MKIKELFKQQYLKQCNKSVGLLQKDRDPEHDRQLEKTVKKYAKNVMFLSKKEKLQKRIQEQFKELRNHKDHEYQSMNILNDPDFIKKLGDVRQNLLTQKDNEKEQKKIEQMLARYNLIGTDNTNITRSQ